MFCKHQFEFMERVSNPHYFLLLYYSHSDYAYRFKCRECGKKKDLPISFQQYYETDRLVVSGDKKKFKVDEINLYGPER